MIVTTTNTIEGKQIGQYLRVVAGETVAGINAFKDISAGFRNLVGGRSNSYEGEIRKAREDALAEMVDRAHELNNLDSARRATELGVGLQERTVEFSRNHGTPLQPRSFRHTENF